MYKFITECLLEKIYTYNVLLLSVYAGYLV